MIALRRANPVSFGVSCPVLHQRRCVLNDDVRASYWSGALLLFLTAVTTPLPAQSLTAGSVGGTVRAASGEALGDVSVTLVDRASGVRAASQTPRDGRFRFSFVVPGVYDLMVERFGYRPQVVQGVPVRAGATIVVPVALADAVGPVIDTVRFAGAGAGGARLSLVTADASSDLSDLAAPLGLLPGAGGILPMLSTDLEADGLPGRFGAQAIDGIVRWSPRHPRLSGAWLDGVAFPLAGVREAELVSGSADAEWTGAAGALMTAASVPASRRTEFRLVTDGGADAQRATMVLQGPLAGDTASYSLGATVRRFSAERPAPWALDSLASRDSAIAQDSFATDLGANLRPYQATLTLASAFGRVDWRITRDHRVSVRVNGSLARQDNPDLGPLAAVALGSSLRVRDLSVAATLTSAIGSRVGSELRVGIDAGSHEYTAPGLRQTIFTAGGLTAGSSSLIPGTFKRTSLHLTETAHVRLLPALAFKAGVGVSRTTWDQSFAEFRGGVFYFGDSTGFAARRGAFRQTVGTLPSARFSATSYAVFGQALIQPSPEFDLAIGLRYQGESLPLAGVTTNVEWRRLTGLDNAPSSLTTAGVAPRLAFAWTVGASRRWQVRGEAGWSHDPTDAGRLAEALTTGNGVSARRGFGALGAWPGSPDSTAVPVSGEILTLFGDRHAPPRTARALIGITGNAGGMGLRLTGVYRHTDFLTRRRDLNLSPAPRARDQYGRVIYGALLQEGGLLGPRPGSNRRFAAFDEVSSLEPTGFSDYAGAGLSIDRQVSRGLSVLASYTYSRTTDNWFGARDGSAEAQLLPFADSAGPTEWARGRSDFDVPHRLALGAQLRLPGRAGVRLTALYRWRSGYPFTPGFRDGVDANGDGSARNDPAFVTDTVQGAAALIAQHPCLRRQVGRLAERNSCREAGAGWLDLRFAVALVRSRGAAVDLYVDGLGLAHPDDAVVDRALYLVDPARALVTNAASGVVNVPLVANPNFGQALAVRSPGAAWRVGLQVGF